MYVHPIHIFISTLIYILRISLYTVCIYMYFPQYLKLKIARVCITYSYNTFNNVNTTYIYLLIITLRKKNSLYNEPHSIDVTIKVTFRYVTYVMYLVNDLFVKL